MNKLNKITSLLIVSLFSIATVQANDDKSGWYVGAGIVFSDLEPITTPGSTLRVSDNSDTGFQILIGNRINSNFAVEFSYADLGEAGITDTNGGNTGTIEYQQATLGGVLYPLGEYKLGGLISPLIGAGLRRTINNSDNGVSFRRVDEYDGYLQLGLEANVAEDWDLRLSYKDYSDDSSIVGVSAIFSAF